MMIWWSALGNSKCLLPKSEELTLAHSEEDTLPDPAQPVKVTKKAVPVRNWKLFDVHQEESRSKMVREDIQTKKKRLNLGIGRFI